ncbi:MAG: nucleotidyl transferase AbiEii/AbiGii toxin family protein [Acidiferrobacterales bacterium]
MLFSLWGDEAYRATRDADFLGSGDSGIDHLAGLFREVCGIHVEDDGLAFVEDSVQAEPIRDDMEYGGVRVTLQATLHGARIPLQVDIGFGDVITPAANTIDYPTLLDSPAPRIRAYPRETVIAEKYQAMVNLGIANTRMKDFYDLRVLARRFEFNGEILATAIRNTFQRRGTQLPGSTPLPFTHEFYDDGQKNTQWRAFTQKGRLMETPPPLADVCKFLHSFLVPPTESLTQGTGFPMKWPMGGPWGARTG